MLTEQMLRRSAALAALNPVASTHHERCDGSGYHKRVRADTADAGACVLAATEVYVGMTTERADRAPLAAEDAAAELRRLTSQGVLEHRATQAVLAASGHGEPKGVAASRRTIPRASPGAKSTSCALPPWGLPHRRLPTGSSSRPKPPTTTSSTSTIRSASPPEPPPLSGPCKTPSLNKRSAVQTSRCIRPAQD